LLYFFPFLYFLTFTYTGLFLELLHVQFVPQVFDVLVVRTAFLLFSLKALEDFLTCCLGLGFLCLDLRLTTLLLLGITL
jgi:hypothetical protein